MKTKNKEKQPSEPGGLVMIFILTPKYFFLIKMTYKEVTVSSEDRTQHFTALKAIKV